MRMRNKPWARPELAACSFFIDEPQQNKGIWKAQFKKEQPLHLELGCGKGGFISQISFQNLGVNYLAIDKQSNMLGIAKRKIEAAYHQHGVDVENIFITAHDIERIDMVLSQQDVIERIYINFCNPWYKDRHKKKRLTHTRQLQKYREFLIDDGEIWFKTDDTPLFDESLEYFKQAGFEVVYKTYDLHNCDFDYSIMTEHEKMFSDEGIKIKFLIAKKLCI